MYDYRAEVVRIVDGDTLDLNVDLGFKVHLHVRARLYGIDTPEVYGVRKDSEEYKAGKEASAFVKDWLDRYHNQIVITSHDGNDIGAGKYGRWLVLVSSAGDCLNDALVDAGHAKPINY